LHETGEFAEMHIVSSDAAVLSFPIAPEPHV
jgi:hypothetical protein